MWTEMVRAARILSSVHTPGGGFDIFDSALSTPGPLGTWVHFEGDISVDKENETLHKLEVACNGRRRDSFRTLVIKQLEKLLAQAEAKMVGLEENTELQVHAEFSKRLYRLRV